MNYPIWIPICITVAALVGFGVLCYFGFQHAEATRAECVASGGHMLPIAADDLCASADGRILE